MSMLARTGLKRALGSTKWIRNMSSERKLDDMAKLVSKRVEGDALAKFDSIRETLRNRTEEVDQTLGMLKEEMEFYKQEYEKVITKEGETEREKLRLSRREKIVRELLLLTEKDIEFYRSETKTIHAQQERADFIMMMVLQERRRRGAAGRSRETGGSISFSFFDRLRRIFFRNDLVDARDLASLQRMKEVKGSSPGSFESFSLSKNIEWPLLQREESLQQVLTQWLKRYRINQGEKQQTNRHPLVVTVAPKGFGCSRFLHMLGTRPKEPPEWTGIPAHLRTHLEDSHIKYLGLQSMVESGVINEDFVNRIANAICVRVTFGHGMGRDRDAHELPSVEDALVTRVLYSYFGDSSMAYKDFMQLLNRTSIPSIEKAIAMIREDGLQRASFNGPSPINFGNQLHVILCVDEPLRGAHHETEDLTILVSSLGELLDKDKSVDVILSTESVNDFSEACHEAERSLEPIHLPSITLPDVEEMIAFYHKTKPWQQARWAHDVPCMQTVRACGGNPQLLTAVFPCLEPGFKDVPEVVKHIMAHDEFSFELMPEIFDPSTELALLSLIDSIGGKVLQGANSPGKRLESLGFGSRGGYLSASSKSPIITPFVWLSWKQSKNWEIADPLIQRIVHYLEQVTGLIPEPRATVSAKAIGEQGIHAFGEVNKRDKTGDVPPLKTESDKEIFNEWQPFGSDRYFENRLINFLRVRALVSASNPSLMLGNQNYDASNVIELTMAEFLGIEDPSSAVVPSAFLQKVAIPASFRLEVIKGQLSWNFNPEPGVIYFRRDLGSSEKYLQCFMSLEDRSIQTDEATTSKTERDSSSGKLGNTTSSSERNKGEGKKDQAYNSTRRQPRVVVFALDTMIRKNFLSACEDIFVSADSETWLNRYIMNDSFAYILAPPERMDFFVAAAVREQIGLARSVKTHVFRRIPAFANLALWETRWEWTSSLADQIYMISPPELVNLMGSSIQGTEETLSSKIVLDIGTSSLSEIWNDKLHSTEPKRTSKPRRPRPRRARRVTPT